jgi:hypothetical protein
MISCSPPVQTGSIIVRALGWNCFHREDDMKLSSLFCASLVAVAALTLAGQGALAATTVSSSKSNGSFKAINVNDAAAVAACKKGGGTLGKDAKGKDACITPKKKP